MCLKTNPDAPKQSIATLFHCKNCGLHWNLELDEEVRFVEDHDVRERKKFNWIACCATRRPVGSCFPLAARLDISAEFGRARGIHNPAQLRSGWGGFHPSRRRRSNGSPGLLANDRAAIKAREG